MVQVKENFYSRASLWLVFIFLIAGVIFVNSLSNVLYDFDDYYHLATSTSIKQHGPYYHFPWAQFTTFRDFFSDKDFLFHLFIVPFLFLFENPLLAAKAALIFYETCFLFAYVWVLKKYLPDFLAALFLILPFMSFNFDMYFIFLRPSTLVNILTILGIYFMINKSWVRLFILSALYTLGHVSFPILIVFVLIVEFVRYFISREVFLKNIYAVAAGILFGCISHPNYPNNLISIHLNAILVPLYSFINSGVDFGGELFSTSGKYILLHNFAVFMSLAAIVWIAILSRMRASLSTLAWWACASVYILLSFFGNRYWYTANILFFIFFASFLKDWLGERHAIKILPKINLFILFYMCAFLVSSLLNMNDMKGDLEKRIALNTHYENAGRWMSANIPEGENIYHAYWRDSAVFMCFNPKDRYLVVLDPIYMLYRYPDEYRIYTHMARHPILNPHEVIKVIFKAKYGYAFSSSAVFSEVKNDPSHFKILYDDGMGLVFEVK